MWICTMSPAHPEGEGRDGEMQVGGMEGRKEATSSSMGSAALAGSLYELRCCVSPLTHRLSPHPPPVPSLAACPLTHRDCPLAHL